jgi:hypothetical protein
MSDDRAHDHGLSDASADELLARSAHWSDSHAQDPLAALLAAATRADPVRSLAGEEAAAAAFRAAQVKRIAPAVPRLPRRGLRVLAAALLAALTLGGAAVAAERNGVQLPFLPGSAPPAAPTGTPSPGTDPSAGAAPDGSGSPHDRATAQTPNAGSSDAGSSGKSQGNDKANGQGASHSAGAHAVHTHPVHPSKAATSTPSHQGA